MVVNECIHMRPLQIGIHIFDSKFQNGGAWVIWDGGEMECCVECDCAFMCGGVTLGTLAAVVKNGTSYQWCCAACCAAFQQALPRHALRALGRAS
jgi:hypothetical protein